MKKTILLIFALILVSNSALGIDVMIKNDNPDAPISGYFMMVSSPSAEVIEGAHNSYDVSVYFPNSREAFDRLLIKTPNLNLAKFISHVINADDMVSLRGKNPRITRTHEEDSLSTLNFDDGNMQIGLYKHIGDVNLSHGSLNIKISSVGLRIDLNEPSTVHLHKYTNENSRTTHHTLFSIHTDSALEAIKIYENLSSSVSAEISGPSISYKNEESSSPALDGPGGFKFNSRRTYNRIFEFNASRPDTKVKLDGVLSSDLKLLSSMIEPNGTWEQWIKLYGSNSALNATNKNSGPRLKNPESQIRSVLDPEFDGVLSLPHPLEFASGEYISSVNLLENSQVSELSNESQLLLDNMLGLIKKRPDDELLILFVGGYHAYDLFFSLPEKYKNDVFFATYPTTTASTLYNSGFKLFLQLSGSNWTTKFDHADAHAAFPGKLFYWKKKLLDKEKTVTYSDLISESTNSTPKIIVIMDTHGINNTELTDYLPSADVLRKSGFKSIKVGIEDPHPGYELSNKPTHEDLIIFSDYSKTLKIKLPGLYKFYNRTPLLSTMLEKGDLLIIPELKGLVNKMQEYDEAGIPISYRKIKRVK